MTNFKPSYVSLLHTFLRNSFMERGISVVICCYNSELRIPKVLTCLQNQKFKSEINWEVLVVDNASTDRTGAVSKECWTLPGVELRIVNEPNPGISHARRRGFEDAHLEIISFVDDDNWVEEEWVQKVYDTMYSDMEIGILGGNGTAAFDETPPAWFSSYERSYAVGPQGTISGERSTSLYGAGLNIRKSTWDKLQENGFKFQLTGRKGKLLSSGEDSELCLAVILSGQKLYYRSDLTFYHFMPPGRLTWEYLVKLTESFSRAEVILEVYGSLAQGDRGFNAMKYQNRFFSLLRTLYDNIKFIPRHLSLIFIKKEGSEIHLKSVYLRNYLKEKISLYLGYPSIVAEIRNGKWNKHTK